MLTSVDISATHYAYFGTSGSIINQFVYDAGLAEVYKFGAYYTLVQDKMKETHLHYLLFIYLFIYLLLFIYVSI